MLDIFKVTYEGKQPTDMVELTLELAAHMIHLGGKAAGPAEGRLLAEKLLRDGSAAAKFEEMCRRQGGLLERPLPEARNSWTVKADEPGHLEYTDLEKHGLASVLLGAGRRVQSDQIDPTAGIEVYREQGAPVAKGDILFKLYAADEKRFQQALDMLRESYRISQQPVARSPLVAKVIT